MRRQRVEGGIGRGGLVQHGDDAVDDVVDVGEVAHHRPSLKTAIGLPARMSRVNEK